MYECTTTQIGGDVLRLSETQKLFKNMILILNKNYYINVIFKRIKYRGKRIQYFYVVYK